MKHVLLCWGILFLALLIAGAQTKTWTGLGDGISWSNGDNWNGGTVPAATDTVLLDNSGVVTSYTVNLPTLSNPRIARLIISPSDGNTITLVLPSSNTGNPGFTVGDSSLITLYDIVLNSGAVLRNSSGASAGNGIAFASATTDSMYIANGARYVHNTLRGNAGIVSQISRATGTETGIVEFDVPTTNSYSPSMSGRTYGSLVFSATAAGGTRTYTASGGSPATIRGNLTIGSGVTFSTTQTGALNVLGNFTNNGTYTTSSQPVVMAGSSAQAIGGTGTYSLYRLAINNSAGVTLNRTVSISDSLILSSGKLTIGNNNIVIAASGGADAGSPSSYVVTNGTGTVTQKGVGTALRIFPVGTATSYNPVLMTNAGVSDTFLVRVQATFDSPPNDPLRVVNRQWNITESVPGGSDATISLQWNASEQASNFSPSNPVYIGRYTGVFWVQTPASVLGVDPYLATASGFSSFSAFGVANVDALPVQLASFTGTLIENNRVRLNWMTISEINNYGFYVQRRAVGVQEWTEIPNSFVPGHGTTNEPQYYSYTDNTPISGATQYRLRQVDLDGTSHYSDPIQVDMPTGVEETAPRMFVLKQNYPNPFNPSTEIAFAVETSGRARLEVYNVVGQKVATLFDDVAEAGRYYRVQFNAAGLASGVYVYRLESGPKSAMKKLMLMK
jgi:hypothetical protein